MASSSEKLLLLLLRQGSCSRAALAKHMRLSRPAVSSLVDGLIRLGILRESGCGVSSGGKPPILLEIEEKRFHAIGIDVGHKSLLRGALCDAAGKLVLRREVSHDNTFESILAQSALLVRELKQAAGKIPVAGVGVSVAGQVDHATNEVVYCMNFPLKNRNFATKLAERCALPVQLENRARCAAQWEYYFGAARRAEDFVFLSVERGVGVSIYQNGKLLRGQSGMAGELRNLAVPSRDGKSLLPVETAMDERENATYLANTVRYIITLLTGLLDPTHIVLGGRLRDQGEEFIAVVDSELAIDPPRKLRITFSESGRIGAALGAGLNIIIHHISGEHK